MPSILLSISSNIESRTKSCFRLSIASQSSDLQHKHTQQRTAKHCRSDFQTRAQWLRTKHTFFVRWERTPTPIMVTTSHTICEQTHKPTTGYGPYLTPSMLAPYIAVCIGARTWHFSCVYASVFAPCSFHVCMHRCSHLA